MSATALLHYGLQRSGTNYLEATLRRRFRVRFVNNTRDRGSIAHKHARLYPEKDLIPEPQFHNDFVVDDLASFEALLPVVPEHFVVISKDPYSWFLSYQRFGERCGWPTPQHHYIEEYNKFYGSFLDLAAGSDRFTFVRYIDLLTDTDQVLDDLQKKASLTGRHGPFGQRRIGRVKVSEAFTDSSLAYYRDRKYLDEYEPSARALMEATLDPDVVQRLGYSVG